MVRHLSDIVGHLYNRPVYNIILSGPVLRSPTGLGKSEFNGEVTLLQGVICTVEFNVIGRFSY